jgi:hypothetical protein
MGRFSWVRLRPMAFAVGLGGQWPQWRLNVQWAETMHLRWSSLTSMRWFKSNVAKRVEVNALHLDFCSSDAK